MDARLSTHALFVTLAVAGFCSYSCGNHSSPNGFGSPGQAVNDAGSGGADPGSGGSGSSGEGSEAAISSATEGSAAHRRGAPL